MPFEPIAEPKRAGWASRHLPRRRAARRRLPPPPLGTAATRGGGMAAWAVGRRAPLLPIFLSPSRRRCRQRERGISVESCFFSPFGIWGSILVRRAAAVRQAELCSQWMGCVTGRCGFNHSVGVRCTRRAPILDLLGALILIVFCWRACSRHRGIVDARSRSPRRLDDAPRGTSNGPA